jgi:putative aldouronate transport system permease protein
MNKAIQVTVAGIKSNKSIKKKFSKILNNYELYLFVVPAFLYFVIFHYVPMYGVQIAFKDFIASKGIWGSPWVGFEHFERFFKSFYFKNVLVNTLQISAYGLVVGFPVPILLALAVNEIKNKHFKKMVQTITYAPHFISTVVMVGMIVTFLAPGNGIINNLIKALGGEPIAFLGRPDLFKSVYVISGVWQNAGWNAIIYLATLASVDFELHEAATIDGANRLQRIWHINIPCLLPMIVILLILNAGSIMSVGFEKVFLMQNQLNIEASEVITTYVYKSGLINAQYGFSSAVGLFNSIVNFILIVSVNFISKRFSEVTLW